MAPDMKKVDELYKKLINAWKTPDKDAKLLENLVTELKVEFAGMSFLPSEDCSSETVAFMTMQRNVMEIGALVSVLLKDIPGFERAIFQLKHYYHEVEPKMKPKLTESQMKYQMLGLDLMSLLAQNRLSEFHMALERIPREKVTDDTFISISVKLQTYLVEGAYNKIFLERTNVPAPYYIFFMDILLETVRDEIADCLEKAYVDLDVLDTGRLLFFQHENSQPAKVRESALAYGKKRNWPLIDNGKSFDFSAGNKKQAPCKGEKHSGDCGGFNAKKLLLDNIYYAKQLEMIV